MLLLLLQHSSQCEKRFVTEKEEGTGQSTGFQLRNFIESRTSKHCMHKQMCRQMRKRASKQEKPWTTSHYKSLTLIPIQIFNFFECQGQCAYVSITNFYTLMSTHELSKHGEQLHLQQWPAATGALIPQPFALSQLIVLEQSFLCFALREGSWGSLRPEYLAITVLGCFDVFVDCKAWQK